MRCNTFLSKDELYRYSRQMKMDEIGKEGQEKIKGSSVVVVGAGALGCPVLQYLTAAGVGTLGIVDNDWIDESNLNRQILYSGKDIGKPKPLIAREKLKQINPNVNFKVHFIRLEKQNALKIIAQYDIVVDCTDNFATRYLINDSCVILKKPLVYGAIHKFSGQLMVLNYNGGPTLRCIYPDLPHPLEIPSCEEFGVIGSVPGMIGCMQATEVIKIILGSAEVLSGNLFMIDTLNFKTCITSFTRNPDAVQIKELGEYEDLNSCDKTSVRELSAEQLRQMISVNGKISIIDLRDKEDNEDLGFETISIPFYDVSKKIKDLPPESPIIFYCRSGSRSASVINYLRKVHNLENTYSLII